MRKLLTFAVLSAVASVTFAQTTQPAVPVHAVTIYSSGVAYFEHSGTINGNADTTLRFKTEQINDILKSLVLQDEGGGKATLVSYPSRDPVERTLKSFEIDLTGTPSLDQILGQLRGAKVTLVMPDSKVTGIIVGVEKQPHAVDKAVIELPAVNLFVDGSFKLIDLTTVRNIELDNPQLQAEMNKALATLALSRDKDQRPVTIHFTGNGNHNVQIGYVVESPIWKSSYRLILDDKTAKLQGWAIVENQTDNDWNNVQLNLVSGRPISFIQDLYSPLYLPRPVVQPENYANVTPQTYGGGIAPEDTGKSMDRRAFGAFRFQAQNQNQQSQIMPRAASVPAPSMAPAKTMENAVSAIASGQELGELFEYSIPNVSIERQKSAMLPIVTDPVEIEKLSIYNEAVLDNHPLNGVRMKNTTGKYLLGGPITVLSDGIYAGDAQIQNVPPGQERLLSYGIDLKMLVHSKDLDEQQQVISGKIVKGVLQLQRKTVATQEYHVQNKSDNEKTLIIEQPIRPNWQLVDTPKPIETTSTLDRFKLDVPAGKTQDFTTKQQIIQGEELAILPTDIDALAVYRTTGQMSPAVKEAVGKALTMKQAVADTQRQIAEKKQTLADFSKEQQRIRENLRAVQANTQYHTRLLTKLNDQETQIEQLHSDIDGLETKMKQQRADLENYVSNLNVE